MNFQFSINGLSSPEGSVPGRSDYIGSLPPLGAAEPGASGTPVHTIFNTSAIGTTGEFTNQDVNGLLYGYAWNSTSLTFSFPTATSNYGGAGYYDQNALGGFQELIASQKVVARYALGLISQYTLLTFTEITETDSTHATLRLAGSSYPSTSYAYYPDTYDTGGDSFFGNIRNTTPTKAGYEFDTIMHEIGHAVGLKHAHVNDGTHGVVPANHSSTEWSIMNYHSYIGADNFYRNAAGSGNQTYMVDDIAALQHMYGANFNTNSGNTVYTWSPTTGEMFINGVGQGASSTNTIYEAIWDGNGTDTYDLSNYTTDLQIDLRPGYWSTFDDNQLADLDGGSGFHLAHGNVANANQYNGDSRSLIEKAIGGFGNDTITGNTAANILLGGAGNDTLTGAAGNDTLNGDSGNDTLDGGSGNDTLAGGSGNDTLDGGSGSDTASYADASAGVSVNMAVAGPQITGGAGTDTLTSIERVIGSNYNDTLTGNGSGNVLSGGAGNDLLNGLTGNDVLVGAAGNDTLLGGSGNDTLNAGDGADTLLGGDGNDLLDGGAGSDTASYADASAGVRVNMAVTGPQNTVGAGTDTLTSIERVIGSNYNDTLTGNGSGNVMSGGAGNDLLNGLTGNDVLVGAAGNDTLLGGSGNDTLNAGANNDTLLGGAGNDILNGEGGTDTASYADAVSAVSVSLALSGAQNTGGAGTDTLTSIERLIGSDYNDTLIGNGGANVLSGGAGRDTLNGGAGNDVLVGARQRDTLIGGGGNDTFSFGSVYDSAVAGPDLITDFSSGDKIDLHSIDADTTLGGDQLFHLGATGGHTGDIVVSYDAGRTVVDLYVNGDATVDSRIWLTGDHSSLASGDFVL